MDTNSFRKEVGKVYDALKRDIQKDFFNMQNGYELYVIQIHYPESNEIEIHFISNQIIPYINMGVTFNEDKNEKWYMPPKKGEKLQASSIKFSLIEKSEIFDNKYYVEYFRIQDEKELKKKLGFIKFNLAYDPYFNYKICYPDGKPEENPHTVPVYW